MARRKKVERCTRRRCPSRPKSKRGASPPTTLPLWTQPSSRCPTKTQRRRRLARRRRCSVSAQQSPALHPPCSLPPPAPRLPDRRLLLLLLLEVDRPCVGGLEPALAREVLLEQVLVVVYAHLLDPRQRRPPHQPSSLLHEERRALRPRARRAHPRAVRRLLQRGGQHAPPERAERERRERRGTTGEDDGEVLRDLDGRRHAAVRDQRALDGARDVSRRRRCRRCGICTLLL